MLLLFLWIVTAKSPCDFTASMCFWGCIVETNRIFEYKPPPHFRLKVGGGGVLLGDHSNCSLDLTLQNREIAFHFMTACTMDFLLIGTLPGMVETMPQRASPEPAATSDITPIPDEGMKQINSSDPSHCAKDSSPDEAQATSDEKENICAAQKGVLKVYIHISGARITITNLI